MSTPPPEGYVPYGLDVLRTYGEGFAGREAELAALDRAWNAVTRVFVLHAEGGAGKTRVVARWLTQMRDAGWRGAGRVFVHSFYSQGSDVRRNASSEFFFEKALEHFGHSGPRLTDPTEQGRTLARLVVEQHGLLVLDGLEPLQQPPYFDQGRLKDPAIRSLLLSLAIGWAPSGPKASGLCVVTSRQPVVELRDKTGQVVIQQPLDRLDAAAGAELLRQLEVRGPARELHEAVKDARGHAYSLMLLGTYLRDATADHEIRRRREIPLLAEDPEHRYHARHLFGAYVEHLGEASPEVAVLRLLGFFDRPADEKLLAVLREADDPELSVLTEPLRILSDASWRRVLSRLKVLRLIDLADSPAPPIDSHPLLRECFAEQVRARFPEAWQAGHRRLFEHLCETTEHWPEGIDGLQPLYQAVAHGCLAGLHEQARADVYVARILRGSGAGGNYNYSTKLGAIGADLGAVACFFTTPWTNLAPSLTPASQAWLLNDAAYSLRALGRLTEAVEPMRAGLEAGISQENWPEAARRAINLCELELTRGEVAAAMTAGEQSVTYADRSGDAYQQMASRTRQANALHQASQRDWSRRLFEDAESRQAAREPELPQLYSLSGFWYCDLLLADTERIAWQYWRNGEAGNGEKLATLICEGVSKRAAYALKIAEDSRWLLDVGLNHLILIRAELYRALLESSGKWHSAADHITAAVDRLRTAGRADFLPRGLLTRAWLQYLSGDEAGCRADLDEAWEIAERGPMPLFQADIQLTRARLFRDRAALEEARRLIEKYGYHRRDGELADALEAARGWELSLGRPAARPHPLDPPLPSPTQPPGEGEAATAAPSAPTPAIGNQGFDVFLSHNSKDKPAVRRLKKHLVKRNLKVWLDEDELQPGVPWQRLLADGIRTSKSVAVLIGKDGLGPWEIEEMEAALQLAVKNKRLVIPVLLPEAPGEVELPLFLGTRTWVDLRPRIIAQRLDRLVWGITNQKPGPR